jgi:hypothetical protein
MESLARTVVATSDWTTTRDPGVRLTKVPLRTHTCVRSGLMVRVFTACQLQHGALGRRNDFLRYSDRDIWRASLF